jgi:hypothetical protein
MTEVKFNYLVDLKNKIRKVESELDAINHLMKSENFQLTIKGVSTCVFKVTRFLEFSDDNMTISILTEIKKNLEIKYIELQKEFESI